MSRQPIRAQPHTEETERDREEQVLCQARLSGENQSVASGEHTHTRQSGVFSPPSPSLSLSEPQLARPAHHAELKVLTSHSRSPFWGTVISGSLLITGIES